MRDLAGVERGCCDGCDANSCECCEFTYAGPGCASIDYCDAYVPADPEVYAQDPVLPAIRGLLECDALDRHGWEPPAECESCGCKAALHRPVNVNEAEARALAVLRCTFDRVNVPMLVAQSLRDTLSLGWRRDGFTYGEVGDLAFLRLLDRLAARSGRARAALMAGGFYDLGCGAGRAVCLAALHPVGFARCGGVELLPGLCAVAESLAVRFVEAERETRPRLQVNIVRGDLLNAQIADASLVMVNTEMWVGEALERLRCFLLRALPQSCVLATIRRPVFVRPGDDLDFIDLGQGELETSWGLAKVFLVERKQRALDLEEMD